MLLLFVSGAVAGGVDRGHSNCLPPPIEHRSDAADPDVASRQHARSAGYLLQSRLWPRSAYQLDSERWLHNWRPNRAVT